MRGGLNVSVSRLRLYDIIRIDHFRGLESYWSVPYGDKTARRGQWIDGPADSLIEALRDALGTLPVIAEDLGYMTRRSMRSATGPVSPV